ncbi:uncharacterized protein [Physcomitrium patens]|uniref:Uncharacterized protein n=2 Tax=Physcomitrium patens TaxID=3218 RepID=A0A2K1KHE2_PHYPA|nr:uncharacterized protein LOC112283406 isoform X1 [Physcomitrium patens]PNR53183.1 hypothetical protein PHYPA_009558 [Physcomitrium patens]|eukprot:XP_024377798.1 uncharacterized protein LOC112283406 isoform X1 [Physcomitrella patens]
MLCHLHCQHMVAPDFYWLPQRRTSVHNIPKIMLKLEPPICPAAQAHSWKHARDITTDGEQHPDLQVFYGCCSFVVKVGFAAARKMKGLLCLLLLCLALAFSHTVAAGDQEAQQYALGRKGMEGKKFKDCGPAKGYPPPYYPPYSPSPDYKSPPYSPTPDYKSPPYSPTPDYKPPESPAYKLVSESTESPPS